MSKPTPGGFYTVIRGDTLRTISRRAYGNDQSDFLKDISPNSDLLKGRAISLEGLPTIRPGDRIYIPEITSRYAGRTVTADFDTEISIDLGGELFKGIKASGIKRAVNTISDGFTFEIPFDYRNRKIVDKVRPYTYQKAKLYIGNDLYITAVCEKWDFGQSPQGTVCTIEARTRPGDMVECMSSRSSLEFNNQTLLQIGNSVAGQYGLKAYSTHGDSDRITKAIKEVTETDFSFLARLAAQKGFLITSSKDGNILFTRAAVDAKPIASLKAGEYPVLSSGASYDGSKRFSSWFGYAESAGLSPVSALVYDESIPVNRPFAFSADESEAENIETAILWRMAKSLADSTSIPVPVAGWRNPEGQLWEENMKVSYWSPASFIFRETDFIIQQVELRKDESGGDISDLSLALPQAYNKKMPEIFPWDGYYEGAAQ